MAWEATVTKIMEIDLANRTPSVDRSFAEVEATPSIISFSGREKFVEEIQVVRFDDVAAAHWELYLLVRGGGSVKIDLVELGYRIINGAMPRVGRDGTVTRMRLGSAVSLDTVFAAVAAIGRSKGAWTGTDQYNCQDFAFHLMTALGCSAHDRLPFELRRAVTKHRPPAITSAAGTSY